MEPASAKQLLSFLSPSIASVNVANFISTKLQRLPNIPHMTNYETWKKQMLCLMESQGLMGYIDGSIFPPHESNPEYKIWERNNALVKGWILGSLGDQFATIVEGIESANDVWSHLENEFYQSVPPEDPFHIPSAASVNVANFVSTKLQWLPDNPAETNYGTWKVQLLALINNQGLSSYLDPGQNLPFRTWHHYEIWRKNNELVKCWILGSLSDEIAAAVVDKEFPSEMWSFLENKFGGRERQLPIQDGQVKCVNYSTRLYRAVLEGNWEVANEIFSSDSDAKTNWIDGNKNSRPIHMAVRLHPVGKKLDFVKNLVGVWTNDDLKYHTDANGSTALHTAASVGNTHAARLLVEREPTLCDLANSDGHFPIHVAALYQQRDVLKYLIEHTNDKNIYNPYTYAEGQQLLTYLIKAKFFDIAQELADKYPSMLQISDLDMESPLTLLTKTKHDLREKNFNLRQHFVSKSLDPYLQRMLQKCINKLAPETKEMVKQDEEALQLLKSMCREIGFQDFNIAAQAFHEAIFVAFELGVKEVIDEIMKTFPGVIDFDSRFSGQNIFQKAVESRSVEVINFFRDESNQKRFGVLEPGDFNKTNNPRDFNGNTPLHSAGKKAPPHILNRTFGAALQMQRELQWFQAVEELVPVYFREQKNKAGKTPKMVFTDEHNQLKELGEKWMKDTATSFTLVAVLIATVMFTGAITVPGGNQSSTGFPMFSKELAFIIFAVADAVSLFASTTSLLFSLAILTSRYAEEDFLHSLPTKLMFGIGTLVLSIISMLVSFIATLYLVFGQKREWALFPLLISACMPLAALVPYQTRLLLDLYSSTFSYGMSGKKTKPWFY